MRFDSFTVVLLELRADAPALGRAATAALQDAHLAYLADLHDSGVLLACGPLLGDSERSFYGLNLYGADVETAVRCAQGDPAVVAGRFTVVALPWAVPTGAMEFTRTRLPRSMAEVDGDEDAGGLAVGP